MARLSWALGIRPGIRDRRGGGEGQRARGGVEEGQIREKERGLETKLLLIEQDGALLALEIYQK